MLQEWPASGPKLLWTATGLGRGYSCPIIVNGRIFITGDVGKDLQIFALDMHGRHVWKATNGRHWENPYPGARACVAYSEGLIYHMNAHGRVACLAADTGKERWAVDTLERFGGRNITWAMSECLLIDGQKVIVTPGGDQALMAALDKKDGRTLWASEPLLFKPDDADAPSGTLRADRASYAPPVLFELHGRRQLAGCSQAHAFGVDADTGKLLWTYPLPTRYRVLAATPALYEDSVFVTGPDSQGGTLLRIADDGDKVSVTPRWISKLDTCHGGVIFLGDSLVGSWYRGRKGWVCLDAKTGAVKCQTGEFAKGSVLYADNRLYILSEEGDMVLAKLGRESFEFTGRFKFVEDHRKDVWAHPVILEGRLYLRYHDRLYCYDIKQ